MHLSKVKNENNVYGSIINFEEKISYKLLKRVFDILLSLIGIIVLAPLLILVAIFIKIEDKNGPVIFTQIRVGKNEQEFKMFKFRSMVSNAEELLDSILDKNETEGAMFKMKNDPRVTKIGKIIRKTSIDELPQLYNVLIGDMSLVGPRPPLKREVEEYTTYHKQRLLIKPGCTGLWQVSGRSEVGFEEMVDLDLRYIKDRSLIYDVKIIFKTFKEIFKSKGAY
ncbi:sugar transferase [Niallia taxi]|uniref:sugar transferase n=1 Tax=Niallia taxi TaxID=2499688 RepID=UPI003AB72BD1